MRLGEILLAAGAINAQQLKAALQMQTQYPGRIGSKLAELGYADVDTVALALGKQKGFTATSRKHVESIDKKLLSVLPPRFAVLYRVIPVGYTAAKPARLVVAATDPSVLPLEELAFAAGTRVDAWIAPECLIEFCLEKYFGLKRATRRFVDMSMSQQHEEPASIVPLSGMFDQAMDMPTGPKLPAPVPASTRKVAAAAPARAALEPPQSARTTQAAARAAAMPPAPAFPETLEAPLPPASNRRLLTPPSPTQPSPEEAGLEAPHFPDVRKPVVVLEPPPSVPSAPPPPAPTPPPPPPSARAPVAPPPPSVPVASTSAVSVKPASIGRSSFAAGSLPPEDDWDLPEDDAVIAPLSAVSARPVAAPTAPPDMLRPVINRDEAGAALKAATTRDGVAEVLVDWLRSTFGCGLVLLVREGSALGWKGFFPNADDDLLEAIAMPLSSPSMFKTAHDSREVFRGAPPQDGAALQTRLWKLLRCTAPTEVLVVPVVLGKRVVNLMYAHPEDTVTISDDAVKDATDLCRDAVAAYTRLVKKTK